MSDNKPSSSIGDDTPHLLPRVICLILAAVGSAAIFAAMRGFIVDSPIAVPSQSFAVSTAEKAVATIALQANGLHTWVAASFMVVSLLLAVRLLTSRRNNTRQLATAKAPRA